MSHLVVFFWLEFENDVNIKNLKIWKSVNMNLTNHDLDATSSDNETDSDCNNDTDNEPDNDESKTSDNDSGNGSSDWFANWLIVISVSLRGTSDRDLIVYNQIIAYAIKSI